MINTSGMVMHKELRIWACILEWKRKKSYSAIRQLRVNLEKKSMMCARRPGTNSMRTWDALHERVCEALAHGLLSPLQTGPCRACIRIQITQSSGVVVLTERRWA